ncbi:hypothetical protein PGT21_026700 [Puccinia graminis f. sp. tritici]|uniref:Uncharacterized protein n=1 Tax=Puccinia graminis f. sp. tritici TaxID=56615 RepID=A0A5B0QPS0_PUCGR|nr:hypothetical protein PGT21_026700 [Puccinia graminis f. sp. tritici]
MSDTGQHQETEAITPAIMAVGPRIRYPIIYLSYQVWVEHRVLFPNGTPSYARRSEEPRTPDNWKYHHECITTNDEDVVPIPPCEVPFQHMAFRDFRRCVIEAVGATRSDFDFTRVLRAADAANKLQWRGYRTCPGGPTPRNMNVVRNYANFAQMATLAALPMRCHLRLFMDDPAQIIGNRSYVIVPFVRNGALPPPPEECFVLGAPLPGSDAGEEATSTRSSVEPPPLPLATSPTPDPTGTRSTVEPPPSPSSWVINTPSSTTPTPPLVESPSYHSSSARSSSVHEWPASSDFNSDGPAVDPPLSSPRQDNGVKAPSSGQRSLVAAEGVISGPSSSNIRGSRVARDDPPSSSGIEMLDGPPSSWKSKDYETIKQVRSSSPDVEVVSKKSGSLKACRST